LRKCLTLLIIMVFLLGMVKTPVFAAQISSVTAVIDSHKLVTVTGIISSGAGQMVNIKITDPNGRLEYADSVVSHGSGNFEVSYTMSNDTAGQYEVLVNALGAAPVTSSFAYGTDNTLQALSISRGSFDQAFSPEITEYSVKVDKRVDSLNVTPTASDSTARVTVNGITTSSGMPSGEVQLNEGLNTIRVEVTALSGQSKTYSISVNKESILSSSLTAEASLDPDKKVTVRGTISSGAGQMVSLSIMDPSGSLEYAGSTVSTAGGNFQFSYPLANPVNGRYTALLGGMGVSVPVSTYFDYLEMTNIAISGITLKPGFQNAVTSYTAAVDGTVSSVRVTPTSSDSQAKITVNSLPVSNGMASSPISLESGENTISVVLNGRDGKTSRTYTINISKDFGVVEEGTVRAEINSDKLVTVEGSIGLDQNRQVSIMVEDPEGKVDYLGTTETGAGGAFHFSYTLSNESKGQYKVSVGARYLLSPLSASFLYDANSAELSRLELSEGSLSPAFASDRTEYSAALSYTTSKVTVRPYAVDPLATIKVNGSVVMSGESSNAISMQEGQNTIRIVVTTPDGQEKTYTIILDKEAAPPKNSSSDNANLSSLTVSAGSLAPVFSTDVTSYTVNVGNQVSEITVTPTTAHPAASVTVNGKAVNSGSASDAISIDVGNNTVLVKVRAENGNEKSYTLTVTREGSTNADLSGITLSNGSINGFAPDKLDYTLDVLNSVTEIQVTPSGADPTATIKVNGSDVASGGTTAPINLSTGNNTISIVVTAQNGKQKTYTITVKRAYNVNLSGMNLSIPGQGSIELTPAFAGDSEQSYTASVANIVSLVNVTPSAVEPAAVIRVNGTVVASGKSQAVNLNTGDNPISITVTAPDNTARTYTITVQRALSSMAYLSGLSVSAGNLDSPFNIEDNSYEVNVGNQVSEITITPTTMDPAASVTVNGKAVNSGSPSDAVPLSVGINTILVKVTAQNGYEFTYTLIVIRQGSSNAKLSALAVSAGTLSPAFAAATTTYRVSVANSVSSITVSMQKDDPAATLIVNGAYGYDNNIPFTKFLDVGDNEIKIEVKAQDGVTSKTYTITVTREESAETRLSSIILSDVGSIPGFDPDVSSYTINVPNALMSIRVTPFAVDSFASIQVNGSAVLSGGTTNPIPLSAGNNSISILVTAQNQAASQTYTITVKRAYNVNLSALELKSEAAPGGIIVNQVDTASYSASVHNAVSSVTVTPYMAAADVAIIQVNDTVVERGSASPPISLNVGPNTIYVTVTAPDETSKTYTITVTRAILYTAELSSLGVSVGSLSPAFNPPDINYTVEVPSHTESIIITPTTVDPNATMLVTGNLAVGVSGSDGVYTVGTPDNLLDFGDGNFVIITVTTSNGTTKKTYNLRVNRLYSYDATLSGLTVSKGELNPAFEPSVQDYTVEVANSVSSITVTPTVNDSYSSVQVEGKEVISGNASDPINLPVGSKKITIRVRPQMGPYNYYYVTVTRKPSAKAELSDLLLKDGETVLMTTPAFASDTQAYTLSVDNLVKSIKVTPTVADATATVEVNGIAVASGSASGSIDLAVGINTITVTVRTQDDTVKEYTITVNRAPSSNADLASLSVTGWALNPVFDQGTETYTLTVGSSTGSIQVRAETAESNAIIEINDGTPQLHLVQANIDLAGQATAEIQIRVTAQDGSTVKTYTLSLSRSSAYSDASLSNLNLDFYHHDEIMGNYDPRPSGWLIPEGEGNGFAPEYHSYECYINDIYDWTDLKVIPMAANPVKSIKVSFLDGGNHEISSEEVETGSSTEYLSTDILVTVRVEVTAFDNVTKEVYTVTLLPLNNAFLRSLAVSAGELDPPFSPSKDFYYITVPSDTESISVTPAASDAKATVTVNDVPVASGSSSGEVILIDEFTQITVVVKARDGMTERYYTLIVTRSPAENAEQSNRLSTLSMPAEDAAEAEGTVEAGETAETADTAGSEPAQPSQHLVELNSQISGGTIQADAETAAAGSTVTLTITPEEGWQLQEGTLKYNDGTEDHAITGESFTMPAANVKVTAEFEEIPSNDAALIGESLDHNSNEENP
jgi:hypothetical protein